MKDVRTHLAAERKDTLVELLMRHAMADEGLRQQLLLDTARSTRNGVNLDTFRQAISNAIESGEFVDYREAYSYFARVDDVITSIAELTDKHPQAVVELVEYALASMERSIGSVDDSDGGTSEILDRLHALHLAACERARPDPLALARTLFEWELRSEWEIFHGAVVRYAKVLGKKGLAAYRALAEAEWARVPVLRADAGDRNRHSSRYQITAIMESLATMSGDLEALVAVKQRDLSSAYAYLTIAQLYKNAGQQDRAMEWAEKGVKDFPQRASSELRTFLAAQYRRLKRHDEAMTLLWTVFADSPTLEHYAALHQYAEPIGKWPVWRERALATVREGIATRGDDAKHRPAYGDTRVDGSLLVRIFRATGLLDRRQWFLAPRPSRRRPAGDDVAESRPRASAHSCELAQSNRDLFFDLAAQGAHAERPCVAFRPRGSHPGIRRPVSAKRQAVRLGIHATRSGQAARHAEFRTTGAPARSVKYVIELSNTTT